MHLAYNTQQAHIASCSLYQSINEYHKVDITLDARRRLVDAVL